MDQIIHWLDQYAQAVYFISAFVGCAVTIWGQWKSIPPPRPPFDVAYAWNGAAGFVMALFAGQMPALGQGQGAYAAALTGYSIGATITTTSRMIQKRYMDQGAKAAAEIRKDAIG